MEKNLLLVCGAQGGCLSWVNTAAAGIAEPGLQLTFTHCHNSLALWWFCFTPEGLTSLISLLFRFVFFIGVIHKNFIFSSLAK